jgi:protein TonB
MSGGSSKSLKRIMPDTRLRRTLKFTIWHGIAASLALHSALAVPFVVNSIVPPPDEPPLLVLDLQGTVADSQLEQKVMQQTKGAEHEEPVAKPEQAAPPVPTPPDGPPEHVAEEGDTPAPPPPSPAQAQSSPAATTQSGSASNIKGAEQQQDAQTIKDPETEKDRVNAYIMVLGKKVRAHLVYPDDGRSAAAVVAFTILGSGQIRSGSLKIVESSGQSALDASALNTIRASAPFGPPPHELNLAITVDFARKR